MSPKRERQHSPPWWRGWAPRRSWRRRGAGGRQSRRGRLPEKQEENFQWRFTSKISRAGISTVNHISCFVVDHICHGSKWGNARKETVFLLGYVPKYDYRKGVGVWQPKSHLCKPWYVGILIKFMYQYILLWAFEQLTYNPTPSTTKSAISIQTEEKNQAEDIENLKLISPPPKKKPTPKKEKE